jgi:ferric enterobactin receptor
MTYFRNILIVFFLIITVNDILFAQNTIKGIVIDSTSNNPLEYAIISVFKNSDQKFVNGTVTDALGKFEVKSLPADNYSIKIEFLGFRTKRINSIVVNQNQTFDVGKISIQSNAQNLQEVVVSGNIANQNVQNSLEKQTFKADQFQNAKGGTAIDVLRNMPSVSINAEGEIRLRGSNRFLVLLNGKPVVSDATTVLSQFPANSIENIEIITSPSAKYDADGKAGIINITTKKGTDDGITIIANAQGGLPSVDTYNNKSKPERYAFDATINYKKQNWDISVGGSFQQNDLAGRRVGDVNTTFDNRFTSFPTDGERSFRRRNYAFRTNITFSANKNNNWTFGFYTGQRLQFRAADIYYNTTQTDLNTGQILRKSYYYNPNLVKKQGDFTLANVDYSHTFGNKSVLSFSTLYEKATLQGFTSNLNVNATNPLDTLQYVNNPAYSPLTGVRTKVDFSIPLAGGKLESGYQFRYQSQTGSFQYKTAILGTSNYVIDPNFSANIDIQNRIHGLYTQFSAKKTKFEYQIGLRYEYSTRQFSSDKLAQPYELTLSNLFPSANLLYRLKSDLNLKVGFSSRVQRSNINELNPYPEREHSETLEQGDPNIKPEFVYLSEIGIVKELKMGSVFATVFNQQVNNVVNRVNSAYNDTILNRIYTNAGNSSQWGLEMGLNLKATKWWTFYAGGSAYYYSIKGTLFNQQVAVSNAAFAYIFNTNQTFQATKTLSFQFNLNYLSQRPTAQGEDSRFLSPNLSVKKVFLNGMISTSILWQNIGLGITNANEQRITTQCRLVKETQKIY